MMVWRGYGILVPVMTVAGYALGKLGAEQIWGSPLPAGYLRGAELAGMLLAAAIVYGLHRLIDTHQFPRAFIDKVSGEEIIVKPRHELFFIPLKVWPYLLALLGIWLFVRR